MITRNNFAVNAVGATITLQDNFTDNQMELLLEDITNAPSGCPALFAHIYRGTIYIENLTGVILTTIKVEV